MINTDIETVEFTKHKSLTNAETMKRTAEVLVYLAIIYIIIASVTFNARNPLCNDLVIITEFKEVMTLKKLVKYQPESYQRVEK